MLVSPNWSQASPMDGYIDALMKKCEVNNEYLHWDSVIYIYIM